MTGSQPNVALARRPAAPDPQAPPPLGWARRRVDMAMRIEHAALSHFIEHGIAGVTVDEIAAAAGISRRTFYRYFATIDEVLTMMLRRALARISSAVHDRPPHESLREAFVNAFKSARPDEDEREIQRLGSDLMEKNPEDWWRAMGRVQSLTREVFEVAVAERLRLAGRDSAAAPMIAGALIAAITHVSQQGVRDDAFRNSPEALDPALKELSATLA